MNARNRKPRVPMKVEIPHTTNLPAISLKPRGKPASASASAGDDDGESKFVDPTEETLLRLAGGHEEMVWRSSAEAVQLRTVLALRALNIKKRIEEQNQRLAVKTLEEGRALPARVRAPKRSTFFSRNIAPFFKDHFSGSSDEDEDDAEVLAARKKKLRDKNRADRKLKQSLEGRLGVPADT
jgi:hypothetical protein